MEEDNRQIGNDSVLLVKLYTEILDEIVSFNIFGQWTRECVQTSINYLIVSSKNTYPYN